MCWEEHWYSNLLFLIIWPLAISVSAALSQYFCVPGNSKRIKPGNQHPKYLNNFYETISKVQTTQEESEQKIWIGISSEKKHELDNK